MTATHLLTQTVSYKTRTGKNSFGESTWSALATAAARVETKVKYTPSNDGVRRTNVTQVMTEVEIPVDSLLWLPGADTANDNEAKVVDTVNKAATPSGYTLYLAEV